MTEITTFYGEVDFFGQIYIGSDGQLLIDNNQITTTDDTQTTVYTISLIPASAAVLLYDIIAYNTTDGTSACYTQYCKYTYNTVGSIPSLLTNP